MSIQRFEFASTDDFGNDGPAFERLEADGEYVRHEDHQSQLAALREENRVLQKQLGDRWTDISALKETVERLADAERRNAGDLRDAERYRFIRQGTAEANYICLSSVQGDMDAAIDAALNPNPNPEAASHDE